MGTNANWQTIMFFFFFVKIFAARPGMRGHYSGPFFPAWTRRDISMSSEMIIDGRRPDSAACSKKKDEGAMPEEELGSVMRTRPSLVTKPSSLP